MIRAIQPEINQIFLRRVPFVRHFVLVVWLICQLFHLVSAQDNQKPKYAVPETALIVDGTNESDIFDTAGKSVYVKGTVTKGVMSFGGDIIVDGRIEGDVATIGGSVYQRSGSFIGGDIIVLGGKYHREKGNGFRDPEKTTVMFTGFQEELRGIMQNPVTLLSPSATPSYFAFRVIAILFWFLVSLGLTTIAPGAVSRAVTRLHLTGLWISAIGALALLIVPLSLFAGLNLLPTAFSAVAGLMALFLFGLAYTFGRVVVQAATGNFILKRFSSDKKHPESLVLLLGTLAWTLALSLPYIWIVAFISMIIISLGLVLTARSPILRK